MKQVFAAMAVIWSAVATCAALPKTEQSITLESGWNAVYVSVAPDGAADDVFADWPVKAVSAYNADIFRVTADMSGGLTGEETVLSPFLVWTRDEPQASTMQKLTADTVLVVNNTNSTSFTTTLRGVPAAPRIAWHKSGGDATYNYIGVRLANPQATVKAVDYFAGCDALATNAFYKVASGSGGAVSFKRADGTPSFTDGGVILIPGCAISDWSGPLFVSPRRGIAFGEEGTLDVMTVRNDGTDNKEVNLEYVASADAATAAPKLKVSLSGITNWDDFETGSNTTFFVQTGTTFKVGIALDRTQFAGTGDEVGGILRFTEQGGTQTMIEIPVTATDSKATSPWPQGLWVAEIKLDKVSFYKSADNRADDIASGGVMPVKVYCHVDSEGKARLMQRVTVAGIEDAGNNITEVLYAPGKTVPASATYSRRLSSAMLPIDMGVVEGTGGAFGSAAESDPLAFAFTIGVTSPSNPFRHALHPLFDNKQMDFKTPAPDGDDFNNYVGSVKPELFSIGCEITFSFDENAASAWSPAETLKGSATWTYTGVRREGSVIASGRATFTRIAKAEMSNDE